VKASHRESATERTPQLADLPVQETGERDARCVSGNRTAHAVNCPSLTGRVKAHGRGEQVSGRRA
jgi:hypothetical protein